MYRIDPEPRIRIAPLLRHVLIADGNAHTAGLLGACLEAFGAGDVDIRWDWRAALARAEETPATLIVTEAFDDADPFALVRAIRRSDMACREAPIVVLTTLATASALKLAKNAGADEFLRKPFMAPNLIRTLDHLAGKTRAWVQCNAYTGPDRRSFNTGAGRRRLRDRQDLIAQGVPATRLYFLRD